MWNCKQEPSNRGLIKLHQTEYHMHKLYLLKISLAQVCALGKYVHYKLGLLDKRPMLKFKSNGNYQINLISCLAVPMIKF